MKLFGRLLLAIGIFTLVACSESTPQEIAVGKDQCENCKMTIMEPKYATQLISQKGRLYKFDDISCMKDYETSNSEAIGAGKTFVADFPSGKFIDAKTTTFIKGGEIKSPMGGNTQAYQDKDVAKKAAAELQATIE